MPKELWQTLTSVFTVLVETDKHVIDLQLFFCEFQQECETVKKKHKMCQYFTGRMSKNVRKELSNKVKLKFEALITTWLMKLIYHYNLLHCYKFYF